MADTEPGKQQPASADPPRTFTQEEVNAMMGKVRREVEGKYAGFDDLKAKAARYDEAQAAAKTDLEKAVERADRAEAEARALREAKARADLAAEVSAATDVPAALIQGDDEEAMRASAGAIAAWAASSHVAPADKGGAAGVAPATADSILAIGDARLRRQAIKDNIELFE